MPARLPTSSARARCSRPAPTSRRLRRMDCARACEHARRARGRACAARRRRIRDTAGPRGHDRARSRVQVRRDAPAAQRIRAFARSGGSAHSARDGCARVHAVARGHAPLYERRCTSTSSCRSCGRCLSTAPTCARRRRGGRAPTPLSVATGLTWAIVAAPGALAPLDIGREFANGIVVGPRYQLRNV